jgi:hypothetical protein
LGGMATRAAARRVYTLFLPGKRGACGEQQG